MAEIISLNRARKAKAKATKSAEADANRVKFGRTKAQKDAEALEAKRRADLLDGAKREDD
ncbi:DUF4169 family protein [uncultured Sphingomonas sp.]|uniref:DUF4169 family protein n=1 Tax=uncultured Sphingomonas sp. TaxID=158754 RepID=UPI0025F892F5|nr:DUF4169 family protein [uncultured Sphingomonas sp.]